MGITEKRELQPFTLQDVKNKNLIIQMLKREEEIAKSDTGQNMYKNLDNNPLVTLNVEHALNRLTLSSFGFDTSDESVKNYRTIFRTYFKSPDDYDKEVIESSYYMRNNKCVFYKEPILKKGQVIPDVPLYELDGVTKLCLYDLINKDNRYTVVAAFSMS